MASTTLTLTLTTRVRLTGAGWRSTWRRIVRVEGVVTVPVGTP